MQNISSSTKKVKESKPVNKKKRSSKTRAKEAVGESSSKDYDVVQAYKTEQPSIDDSSLEASKQELFDFNANESNKLSALLVLEA